MILSFPAKPSSRRAALSDLDLAACEMRAWKDAARWAKLTPERVGEISHVQERHAQAHDRWFRARERLWGFMR